MQTRRRFTRTAIGRHLAFLLIMVAPYAYAQPHLEPGTPASLGPMAVAGKAGGGATVDGLYPFYTSTGPLSLSIDGVGTVGLGVLQVEKPAGATVRQAFLLSTIVWNIGGPLRTGAVELEGVPVAWDGYAPSASGVADGNAYADVTATVKPILDAAPPGVVDLTVQENVLLDGTILAVVFDDPEAAPTTVALLFGAQPSEGAAFVLGLAEPFSADDQTITLSLGISFSFQGSEQASLVDVNGQRLTSAAGGYDDGFFTNGGLITVGGVGDDAANPPDPLAGPSGNPRYDDELYTLDPFVDDGDRLVRVSAQSAPGDNLFFAAFAVEGSAAVFGEGIVLSPATAENPVGTEHTVTARLQADDGAPIVGRQVDFEVTDGPNAGLTGAETTDGNGEAAFTWTSATPGTDTVVARFTNGQGERIASNPVTKTWLSGASLVACADATLRIVDFRATAPERVVIENEGAEPVDLSTCAFASWQPFTEEVIYSADLAGALSPSASYTLAVAGANQALPANSLFDGPGAIGVFSVPAASLPPGTPVTAAVPFTVAAIVYQDDETIVGEFPDPEDPDAADLAVLLSVPDGMPGTFALGAAYPNPFNPATTIAYTLGQAADVRLTIYDALGRQVRTLVAHTQEAGAYEARWDGRDASGQAVASGVYLYRLEAGAHVAARAMLLAK